MGTIMQMLHMSEEAKVGIGVLWGVAYLAKRKLPPHTIAGKVAAWIVAAAGSIGIAGTVTP